MENKYKKVILFLIAIALSFACERFEARGFIFSYNNADQRFDQSMKWNNENITRELTVTEDNYTIFVMSDSHVGTTNNLDHFLDSAKNENAIAAVMTGDLTEGHPEDYALFQERLPTSDSLITFQMAGNHDLYFDGWKQYFSIFGSSTYFFTVSAGQSSDLFICLDTGGGTLGSKQLEWLKMILSAKRDNYRHCILFTHNNLFRIRHTSSTNPNVEELRVLTELSIKHQIDMIVTGHDHKRNVVSLGNTIHITMDALKDNYQDAGYLKLMIREGEINYSFVKI